MRCGDPCRTATAVCIARSYARNRRRLEQRAAVRDAVASVFESSLLIGSYSGLGHCVCALGPSSAHLIPQFSWQSAAIRIWLERLKPRLSSSFSFADTIGRTSRTVRTGTKGPHHCDSTASGCLRVSAIGASQESHHFV